MKTISICLFFLCTIFFTNAQSYSGTIAPASPKPGTTITVNFSLTSGLPVLNLVIYMYNSTTKTYAALPATATFNSSAYYAYYTIPANTPNNTLLQFTIGTNTTPPIYYGVVQSATVLPIIFESYTAILNTAGNINLKWKLASTDGMDKSVIYRSTDGKNFTPITTLKGSVAQSDYAYTDVIDPIEKAYFYKIACVSIDGDEIISNTLYVSTNGISNMAVPKILNNANVTSQLFVSGINLTDFKTSEINIFDVSGRKYQSSVLNNSTVNTNNLRTGIYYLKIANNKPLVFMVQ
jgi:hypothetical protein